MSAPTIIVGAAAQVLHVSAPDVHTVVRFSPVTEAPLTKMSPLRRTLAALGALTLASSLQACQDGATTSPDNTESHRASSTGPESTPTPQETSSSPSAAAQSVLIDVRTPEEFATGHLEGALNINFNADDFTSQIEK